MIVSHEDIINSDAKRSLVIAAAASGKTYLLTEKVRKLLKDGADPNKMVVITFTNLAANEMKIRLGADYREGMFIGTIHGFANHCLSAAHISTDRILNNNEFDELFTIVKRNQYCLPIVDWLFLDEAQDSDELQFEFIFKQLKPENFFVVGDFRQAIYQFKGSDPTLMMQLINYPGVTTFNIINNYRNGSEILDFARTVAARNDFLDNSKSLTKKKGQVIKVRYDADTLVNGIAQIGEWGTWFILCRTNIQCDKMKILCEQKQIPAELFSKADFDSIEEINDKLKNDTVKIMTIHQAKGLESPRVIVIGANYRSAEEVCISYVAATRAKDLLIWTFPSKPKKRKATVQNWEK